MSNDDTTAFYKNAVYEIYFDVLGGVGFACIFPINGRTAGTAPVARTQSILGAGNFETTQSILIYMSYQEIMVHVNSKLHLVIAGTLFFVSAFINAFMNFVPSHELSSTWPIVLLVSFGLIYFQFGTFNRLWMELAYSKFVGKEGVKTIIGTISSGTIAGVVLPIFGLYILTMNTIPFLLTHTMGTTGETVYKFEKFSKSHSRRRTCRSQYMYLQDADIIATRICVPKTNQSLYFSKGDKLLLKGIKSDFGIIPKSYQRKRDK